MKTVESKTQRWNMRVAEDVDAIVRLAAEQTDQPLTDFVVQAARVVAEDTLADRRVFRLNETAWDEFVVALTLINSPDKRTLPVGLEAFQGAHQTAWGPLFAASMIATVPTILVYVAAQRWFQRGFSVGAIH